jgi:hypothetical protein
LISMRSLVRDQDGPPEYEAPMNIGAFSFVALVSGERSIRSSSVVRRRVCTPRVQMGYGVGCKNDESHDADANMRSRD